MWTYNQNPVELYHHGIKGQKWGVRRAQRKATRAERRVAAERERKAKSNVITGRTRSKKALMGMAGVLVTTAAIATSIAAGKIISNRIATKEFRKNLYAAHIFAEAGNGDVPRTDVKRTSINGAY